MLRIMMKPQGPPAPQPAGPQGAMPDAPPLPQGPDKSQDPDKDQDGEDSCQTSQQIAGYMGPENGPFECERCKHFQGPSSCDLVAGKIDPEGCCNLFEPDPNAGPDNDNDEDAAPGHPDVASLLAAGQGQGQ